MKKIRISVVICSHNPRTDYLRRVLEALDRQTLPKSDWELILIDNASEQRLSDVMDLSWHPQGRHVREEELGLTLARLRGIRESRGELLVFVDDDNVLSFDYLKTSEQIAEEFSRLGCWGSGCISPEFELRPDPFLSKHLWMLALRDVAKPVWGSYPDATTIPWGAGLVVRRQVALSYVQVIEKDELRKGLGRSGRLLNSGEDDEFSWVSSTLGMGCGIFPLLKVTHLIDKQRSTKAYLLKLREGHSYSDLLMDHLHGKPVYQPAGSPTFRRAFFYFMTGQMSAFFGESSGAWFWMRMSPMDRAFAEADLKGKKRAWEKLHAVKVS